MIKTHKIRLNPKAEQKTYFYRASGVARFAWNWALEEYKRRKAAGQEVDWNDIKREFRARIDAEFPFVREVTKCAAEAAISDLRQAINTYYKTKETTPKSKVKFPGLRKRSKGIGGFGLNNDKFSVSGHNRNGGRAPSRREWLPRRNDCGVCSPYIEVRFDASCGL